MNLITQEIEVLEMLAGTREPVWGSWVSACLERLAEEGLCTRGPNYQITAAGLKLLERKPK